MRIERKHLQSNQIGFAKQNDEKIKRIPLKVYPQQKRFKTLKKAVMLTLKIVLRNKLVNGVEEIFSFTLLAGFFFHFPP